MSKLLPQSRATFIICLLSLFCSLIAGFLAIKTNQVVLSQCVTKADWDTSLQHFFQYGDVMNVGDNKLLPRNVISFYQQKVECVSVNMTLGTKTEFDRQLELLPRLQMVDSVKVNNKGAICASLASKQKVCSKT